MLNKKNITAIAAVLLLLLINQAWADEILCTNGAVIKGKVIKVTDENIVYKITPESNDKEKPLNSEWQLERKFAAKITYNDGTQVSLLPDENLKKFIYAGEGFNSQYAVLGFSLGMPSMLNINAGYYWQQFGIHVSGLYLEDTYGVQCNLLVKISESRNTLHGIALIGGLTSVLVEDSKSNPEPDADIRGSHSYYAGLAYNFYYKNFFFEAGFAWILNGDLALMLLQIGYVHRFM